MQFWTAIGSQCLEWFDTGCIVLRLANGPINRLRKFSIDRFCYNDAIDKNAQCFDIFLSDLEAKTHDKRIYLCFKKTYRLITSLCYSL